MSKFCALAFHQTSVTVSDGESGVLVSVALHNELEQCIKQNKLSGKRTVAILSSSDYQLLRVKKPEVPANEMLTAILWQEQARLSLPIEQLVVDYVESPVMTKEKRIYVAAVARRALKENYQALCDVRLEPIKITLPEFVYGHYVQRNYSAETTVIWVNYFQDVAQVYAFYQGELIATLKLPKAETLVMSQACFTALNLFYFAEIKAFSDSPLWLMNGLLTIDPSMLTQIIGRIQWLNSEPESHYRKAIEHNNHSTVSHAYYGMLANE